VSCPDWKALAAARESAEAEPAEWTEAMAHFDACPRCRREAVAADPLLVFRRLPAMEMPAGDELAEAEAMRQAVSAMRTARRLERHQHAGWKRWAAAAVLALASLSVSWDKAPRTQEPEPVALKPAVVAPTAPRPVTGPATLEALDGSNARVYQMNGEGVTAFMIVANKTDV
jgi:hypothetical protein